MVGAPTLTLMANERVTEDLVDEALRGLGFFDDPEAVFVEKQQSHVIAIRAALSKASKTGKGGIGYPEFIITDAATPDMVVLIECKADVRQHESKNRDKPVEYAVDGVLHYARALSPAFTVIAFAVSGTRAANRWSAFLLPKGRPEPRGLKAPSGAVIAQLVPMADLIRAASYDPEVKHKRTTDLIAFSQVMHKFMRDEAELEEKEKPLAVAGTLIALTNQVFAKTYGEYSAKELPGFWMQSITNEVVAAKLPVPKIENMTQPFTAIEVHPELRKPTRGYPKGLLNAIVSMLAEQVLPFLTVYHDFDVVGQFYGEFLKYTGGDGKGLGIVLTPRHVTELFALLANVTPGDVVLDTCAGTGGFLINAMNRMVRLAPTEAQVEDIKRNRLVGVEQQATMYALAASNMILRGDGKANLHQGSSFDVAITKYVKGHKPTVGLLNPPYAKSKADLHELRFVEHMLDCLEPGGRGIAIVPVSCATTPSIHKENLLRKHTLEAVMSMPPEVFHPVGVITCVVAFTAGVPHAVSDRKTFFGLWREDGFVKVKNAGRIDRDDSWSAIRDGWVEQYRNREVRPGQSVMHKVDAMDEWLAEAYMETDYSTLSKGDLGVVLRDFAMFSLGFGGENEEAPVVLDQSAGWAEFKLGDLFEIKKGRRVTKANRRPGGTRFIGASERNNGVTDMVDLQPLHEAGCLTVPYNGASVGCTFYQDRPFFASDDVNVLVAYAPADKLALLFVAAVIRHGRGRFTYGYKWTLERMKLSTVRLPATTEGRPDWSEMSRLAGASRFSAAIP